MSDLRPSRVALVGLGHRATTTYLPLVAAADGRVELVGVLDPDRAARARFLDAAGRPDAVQQAVDLDALLRDARPDVVIVASPDDLHAAQVETALRHGTDVFCEKPIGIGTADVSRVLHASRASDAALVVGHNLRFHDLHRAVKDVIDSGRVGRVTTVAMTYYLLPGHGESYLRRWHRTRARSGGLEVTKACHHLDLLTWWMDDVPVEVSGRTSREHYTSDRTPPDADIDDTVAAVVRYAGGGLAMYTLVGRADREGCSLHVQGTGGRVEVEWDAKAPPGSEHVVRVLTTGQAPSTLRIPVAPGRHGGADARMLRHHFDPWDPGAGNVAHAAVAVTVGEAITRSSRRGATVDISGTDAVAHLRGRP
ncbi:Gfo/Idh/MocA family protein [Cellulomonas biazotea]|uniref:Gfo/Idh/MocA family protein n=1 Tax=Cellulomonas biazotea TaxID=1709 RepID=UPI0013EF1AF9|nr:Gfo/Idh/MocA family oxidoreductase [Cellulomonas biazotea]